MDQRDVANESEERHPTDQRKSTDDMDGEQQIGEPYRRHCRTEICRNGERSFNIPGADVSFHSLIIFASVFSPLSFPTHV